MAPAVSMEICKSSPAHYMSLRVTIAFSWPALPTRLFLTGQPLSNNLRRPALAASLPTTARTATRAGPNSLDLVKQLASPSQRLWSMKFAAVLLALSSLVIPSRTLDQTDPAQPPVASPTSTAPKVGG